MLEVEELTRRSFLRFRQVNCAASAATIIPCPEMILRPGTAAWFLTRSRSAHRGRWVAKVSATGRSCLNGYPATIECARRREINCVKRWGTARFPPVTKNSIRIFTSSESTLLLYLFSVIEIPFFYNSEVLECSCHRSNVLWVAIPFPYPHLISNMSFCRSCLIDMCECPDRMCYCESVTAYAHECQRLGILLPSDWRVKTTCFAKNSRI